MRDDNTPTGKARQRKHTPHQRLRLEKAKILKQKGALTKKKREAAKGQKPSETNPENTADTTPSAPKMKKNALSKPAKPPAKFRKRQIHKSWLPTHLWHAKRARMTEPKDPLWRFAIPLTPTEKCFRTSHRAASMRGCLAWDVSYTGTIGLEGIEASLLGVLRSLGVDEGVLSGRAGMKWRKGTRGWEGWLRQRDPEQQWIAPCRLVWCAQDEGEVNNEDAGTEKRKKTKRRLLIRVHPSAFLQLWNEIIKVAKMQRPPATAEDLRFEIGSIEITGPASTEALVGALHPARHGLPPKDQPMDPKSKKVTSPLTVPPQEDPWIDIPTSDKVWPQLVNLTNVSALPSNAILAFDITDPRLHHPPRKISLASQRDGDEALLSLLSSWPPDQTLSSPDIFNRTKRLTASRLLASQKSINRRKANALPGQYPEPTSRDPKIPILLLASRPPSINAAGQGTWTLLLPWDCVLPVWYSLMHCPLSTGNVPRFGCLQEKRQIAFEQGMPWFPGDFPGTKAGWEWENWEREIGKRDWDKRPKGKRPAWESVDLGLGRRGEIGRGWACDWEMLVLGKERSEAVNVAEVEAVQEKGTASQPDDRPHDEAAASTTEVAIAKPPRTSRGQDLPPYGIHHIHWPSIGRPNSIHPTALTPIHLTPLTTGHPQRRARIYRVPTTNPSLRQQWLALASSSRAKAGKERASNATKERRACSSMPSAAGGAAESTPVPAHERTRRLAASLLAPPPPSATNNLHGSLPVPDETDLIGFITSASYDLTSGRCSAVGNVLAHKALELDIAGNEAGNTATSGHQRPSTESARHRSDRKGTQRGHASRAENLCIIRSAGESFARLARWDFHSCSPAP